MVEPSREDGANAEDVRIPEVAEGNSRELVDVVASKDTTATTAGADAEAPEEDGDLAGRITTNHSETAMRLLISNRTGRCWRRLTSTVWLN